MFNISFVRIFALTLIIFAGCLITAKAQIVTKGLVSWWSFDKTSIEDENVKDIYGEHDGIIFGEPKIVNGKRNEALDFGEGNNYVEVKAKGDLVTMDGSYTVLLWAFSRSGGGLFYNYGDEGNAQIEIRQDPEAVQMAIRDNSKNEMNIRPETEMEKWNYLGYVWDSKTGTLTGYVNGEKAGEAESELGDIDNSFFLSCAYRSQCHVGRISKRHYRRGLRL